MKPTTSQLNALLANRQWFMVSFYTFNLVDGTNLYYTNGDEDITYGGNTYSAGGQIGPYFDQTGNRGTIKSTCGLEVSTMSFDVLPGAALIEGKTFLSAVLQGLFDGAVCTRSNVYMSSYGTIVTGGVVTMFVGRIAEVVPGRNFVTFNVNSMTELLNMNMPRDLYQTGCVNNLYDTNCTLIKSSFATLGTCLTGCTTTAINATLTQATGYFTLGSLKFTSGANNNQSFPIRSYTHGSPSIVTVGRPFTTAPANGDTFVIYPGCDKAQSTCSGKFSNLVNFRGFPYVPEDSTAV